MRSLIFLFSLLLSFVFVNAQTQTVVDDDGNTVVEEITLNPAGLATTITLSTIVGTTSTTSTTTPVGQQGPVGQPVSTPTDEPTVFQYTTLDAAGNTLVLTATFTPTFQPSVAFTPTGTGSILDYSQYLSLVGTNTVESSISGASQPIWRISKGALGVAVGIVAGVWSGVWLVMV